MSRPLPSPRQLGYLLAWHAHGHFGRAAAASFVTQSALAVGRLAGIEVSVRAVDGAAREVVLAWRRGHARAGDFALLAETVRGAFIPSPGFPGLGGRAEGEVG